MKQGETALTRMFRERARERGLSNPALAELAQVEYRLVLRLMKGQTVPHEHSVSLIAAALGIPETSWRPALVASRAARAADAQDPLYQYAEAFLDAHQDIRPPAMSQTNKAVRVRLADVYVSLNAEVERERRLREDDEVNLRFAQDENADAGASEQIDKRDSQDRTSTALADSGDRRQRTTKVPVVVELSTVLAEHDVAIILGQPGSGKTTLLIHAGVRHAGALQAAAKTATDASGRSYGPTRLPVYVRVADYAEKGPNQPILTFIRDTVPTGADGRKLFDEWWDRGSVLILLDGLDEITEQGRRSEINSAIEALIITCRKSSNQLIVSSRIYGYQAMPLNSAPEFAICDMNREQVDRFFKSWCVAIERETGTADADTAGERRAKSILSAIDSSAGVRELAVNPLLCVLIALIQQANVVLPERRVVLMEKAVEALLRVWRLGQTGVESAAAQRVVITIEEESHVLQPLALWLHRTRPSGLVDEEALASQIADGIAVMRGRPVGFNEGRQVEEFLGRVRNHSGILIERGTGYYGFLHLLFEEYLAGRELVDDPEEAVASIREYRHQPRWEEPIRLGIASLPRGHAASMIRNAILNVPSEYEDVLLRDRCLAARCLGDCEAAEPTLAIEIAKKTAETLIDPRLGRIEPLREKLTDSARGLKMHTASCAALLEPLTKALSDENWQVRQYAAQALGSLGQGSEEVVRALIKAVSDENWMVRQYAVEALGSLGQGSEEVVRALIKDLSDDQSYVRGSAAQALGSLGQGSEEVVRALIKALSDENWQVRQYAVEALGSLGQGSEEVVRALIKALSDENWQVRQYAAQALGSLGQGSEEVVRALIKAFSDENWMVRQYAAQALGSLGQGSEEVVRALIKALSDDDNEVRQSAAQALGSLGQGSEEVVRALIKALSDDDNEVRRSAAQALGSLGQGSEEVVRALIKALSDDNSYVRRSTAQALGSLGQGSEEVVRALIKALSDDNSYVRPSAARALGSLGQGSEEIVRALIKALSDDNWRVRQYAAQALGSLGQGSEEVVRTLIKALSDDESYVRPSAAQALGSLGQGSEEIVRALIKALSDDNWRVRQYAAQALGSLGQGSEEVVRALIKALSDDDNDVRNAAWLAIDALARCDGTGAESPPGD